MCFSIQRKKNFWKLHNLATSVTVMIKVMRVKVLKIMNKLMIWMWLCRINQSYGETGNPLSDNVDWFKDVKNMPINLLKESSEWIYQQRKDAEQLGQMQKCSVGNEQGVIGPENVNEQQ